MSDLAKNEDPTYMEFERRAARRPMTKYMGQQMHDNMVRCSDSREGVAFPAGVIQRLEPYIAGGILEMTVELMKGINEEMQESKKILQDLVNQVRAMKDPITTALIEQIKEVRSSRMALVSELRESLNAMREVRKFFLESEYQTEMERLERFVKVCKDIQTLKTSGVFDAVVDSAIRLAIQDGKQ